MPAPMAAVKLAAGVILIQKSCTGHWSFGLVLSLIELSGLLFLKVRGGAFALALRGGK